MWPQHSQQGLSASIDLLSYIDDLLSTENLIYADTSVE